MTNKTDALVTVQKIETVTGDFMTNPGNPFWRIEINGYCADFDHEEAASNFAAAIARLSTRPADGGLRERMASFMFGMVDDRSWTDPHIPMLAKDEWLSLADAAIRALQPKDQSDVGKSPLKPGYYRDGVWLGTAPNQHFDSIVGAMINDGVISWKDQSDVG